MKRLVGYIRQSLHDAASSSPERQAEIIEAWAKAHGYIVAKIYRDIGGKRSESDNVVTRKEFQNLLKDADARKFDIIVVASQERFGTSDFYEFVGYLDRFNKLGIELWDAGKNLLLNPHGTEAAGILQSTIGTIIDTGEQMARSRNTITGQTTKARKGQYLGGYIAYGVAIKCVDIDGRVLWISEMVGKKLYETQYADGRVSVKPYTPCGDRAPSDRLLFCRSRYNDRIRAVQLIYEFFLAGMGASKIAGELNSLGYRLPGGRLFYNTFVQQLIGSGHVYTGRVAFFKTSKGKFYQGNKNSPVPVKNLKGGHKTKNNIDDWLVSEEVFEPIISMEDFHRAHDLLVSRTRPRARQNPKAVYAGFLICENCGIPMTANRDKYCCTTYLNNGGPKSGCAHNNIKSCVIDTYVDAWLEETGQTLAWTSTSEPVASLYKVRDINDRMRSLMVAVEHFLAVKLGSAFPFEEQSDGSRVFEIPGLEIVETAESTGAHDVIHRFRLPGYDGDPSFLQNLLGAVEASENASQTTRVAAWQARKAHLLSIFPEAQNQSLREALVRELNTLDSQIVLAQEGVTDYAKQHRELLVQLHEIYRCSRRARTIEVPQARRKALQELIAEIRCKFVQVIMGKKRLVSRLSVLSIIPELGDAYVRSPGHRAFGTVPASHPAQPSHRKHCREPAAGYPAGSNSKGPR